MEVLIALDVEAASFDESLWRTRLEGLMAHLELPRDSQLSVSIVDDATIADLNLQHRGKDGPTDVLSFPQFDFPGLEQAVAELSGASVPAPAVVVSREPQPLPLGDIVVSLDAAGRQADEFGHSLERELGFLLVHGLLHLLGEDHLTAEQDGRMRELQRECLTFWNLGI